jgi:hypothetical protein
MLQTFQGIIDARGLCTLQQDEGALRLQVSDASQGVPFWAVLDHRVASGILRELLAGNHSRALRLLEERAISLGSKRLNF